MTFYYDERLDRHICLNNETGEMELCDF